MSHWDGSGNGKFWVVCIYIKLFSWWPTATATQQYHHKMGSAPDCDSSNNGTKIQNPLYFEKNFTWYSIRNSYEFIEIIKYNGNDENIKYTNYKMN